MGARGPAPKPTSMRLLHGDRKDRINTDEPIPSELEVKCPTWLPKPSKTVWNELAPDLIDKKVLTFWDIELFANFCYYAAMRKRLIKRVEEEGEIVLGDKDVPVKNPALQLIRDASTQMISIGSRFGLTPSDRASLSFGDEGDKSKGAGRLLS